MSPARRRLLPWIALGVVYVVWGSTYLFIRLVVQELPPFVAAGMRFAVAGVVMLGIARFVEGDAPRPTRRQVADYALVGVALLGVGNGLVMWAEQRVPSGIAALVVASVPLWITLFDGLRPGGQPWTGRVWGGTAVGLLGVALIVRPHSGGGAVPWASVLALQTACISWTMGSLYAKSVRQRLPVLTASAVEMLAGSVALFAGSRAAGEPLATLAEASPRAWLSLAYLAVLGSLVGFTAFAYCLNELPATTVGTYAYVNPVVAVALGALVLKEPLSAGLLLGAGLILAAVMLTTTAPPKPAPSRSAPRVEGASAAT